MEEFSSLEMEFLAGVERLPEEYRGYLKPPLNDGLIIPSRNKTVGDMAIQSFESYLFIKIGNHTQEYLYDAIEALVFIDKVLRDKVVFYFHGEGVDYYKSDQFSDLNEIDRNMYVWSGTLKELFRNK